MVDYSKFDNIDVPSDDEEDNTIFNVKKEDSNSNLSTESNNNDVKKVEDENKGKVENKNVRTKKNEEGRFVFEYNGETIYEWEQSLEECNIYLKPPPNITRKMLDIQILVNSLKIGIKGEKPFLDEPTGGPIIQDESFWTISDGELQINLQKMRKGENWQCALAGAHRNDLDAYTQEEEKKKLLLERFQEEHAGFDFSNAEFNGNVPDTREFMGGVKYN